MAVEPERGAGPHAAVRMAVALLVALLFAATWAGPPVGGHEPAIQPAVAPGVVSSPIGARTSDPASAALPRPPFGPLDASAGPAYTGHYYSGADYSGSAVAAQNLSFEMTVPQDSAEAGGDFFYVLMSVWDSASSYDQLGFTDSNGTWGLSYSSTGPCASSYNFSADARALTGGATYRFEMGLAAGNLSFSVAPAGGSPLWTRQIHDGASAFYVQNNYTCNGVPQLDFTDYEEVYRTAGPVPPYAFAFVANSVDGRAEDNWSAWSDQNPPAGVIGVPVGSTVTIENVPFYLAAAAELPAEVGSSSLSYAATVTIDQFGTSSLVTLNLSGSVAGATVAIRPASGIPPFTADLTVNVSASTPAPATDPIEIEATDTAGGYARLALTVDVEATLHAALPVASPTAVDLGRTVTLSENVSGGSAPFLFHWTGLPSGCASTNASFSCVPNATGDLLVSVTVTDALGFTSASSPLLLVVAYDLAVSVVADVSAIDVGQTVEFTVKTSGGSGNLTYAWSWGTVADCLPPGSTLSCQAKGAGLFGVSVSVRDVGGSTAPGSAAVRIYTLPQATIEGPAGATEVGVWTVFSLLPTGGAGGDRAGWSGTPAGCTHPDALSVRCQWSTAGTYSLSGYVTDRVNGTSAPASLTVTVLTAVTARLSASPTPGLEHAPTKFTVTVSGGEAPFRIAWTGLPAGCAPANASVVSCRPGATGTFVVTAEVTDALGVNASANATYSVGPSLLGLPPALAEGLIAGIWIAIVALAIVVTLLRGRRRPVPADAGGPAPGSGAPAADGELPSTQVLMARGVSAARWAGRSARKIATLAR
jgi:hypothetical protein